MVLTETESGFAVYPSVDRASFPVLCPPKLLPAPPAASGVGRSVLRP